MSSEAVKQVKNFFMQQRVWKKTLWICAQRKVREQINYAVNATYKKTCCKVYLQLKFKKYKDILLYNSSVYLGWQYQQRVEWSIKGKKYITIDQCLGS